MYFSRQKQKVHHDPGKEVADKPNRPVPLRALETDLSDRALSSFDLQNLLHQVLMSATIPTGKLAHQHADQKQKSEQTT
jgi:hypothetical protein